MRINSQRTMSGRRAESEIEAFSAAVREHQAMVYSIGWHLVRDAALAEELAQDVFLKLFENWDSFESRDHIKTGCAG